jgi:hypothetical protein
VVDDHDVVDQQHPGAHGQTGTTARSSAQGSASTELEGVR